MPAELVAKPVQEPREPRHDIPMQPNRLGQRHPHPEMRWQRLRRDRLRLMPQGLVEPPHQPRPEAAGKGHPGQRDEIGDPAEAEAATPAVFHGHALEMRDAGDVGDEPVHAVARDHRGVAPGPAAECRQHGRFPREIGGAGCEIGADRPSVGERHAPAQAPCFGSRVQAVNVVGIPGSQDQGERPLTGAAPQLRVACQSRKPDGKQPTSHPSAASSRQEFPFCS